jgi:hypothetical protein
MATMNWKRRRAPHVDLDEPLAMIPVAAIRPRWRWPRMRFWSLTLLLLALVLWFAPTIVAHTPLLNQVLASLTADLNGTLTAQSASLGWLSPVALEEVELRDADDQTLLRAARIELTQSLWSLLVDGQNLGDCRIQKPELRVVLTRDGANVEQVLANYLAADRTASLNSPAVHLEFDEGTLAVDDAVSDRHWQIEALKLDCTLARDWSEPMKLAASGTLPQPDRAGKWKASLEVSRLPNEEAPPITEGKATLHCDGLPLSIVETLARRYRSTLSLSGWLSTDLKLDWKPAHGGKSQLSLDGQVEAEQLALADPALGNDQFRLERVRLPLRGSLGGDQITVSQCAAYTDVGEMKLTGPVTLPTGGQLAESLSAALKSESYTLSGNVDLARLAAVLPETLRLRRGAELTSGQVSLDFSRRRDGERALWQANVQTTNLVATHGGKTITWKKPLAIEFNAHDEPTGVVIDKLVCDSKFLEIEAAGQFDQLSASAIYDLNKLAAELGQFVDLRGIDLAGDGWSYMTWKRGANGRFEADGEFQVRQFRLAAPGRQPWTEENLVMLLSLVGQADAARLTRLDAATLSLDSEPDKLTAKLTEPVSDFSAETVWPVELEASGKLATWITRLTPLVGDWQAWNLAGDCRIEARGRGCLERLEFEELQCEIDQFQLRGRGLTINEPQLAIECAGDFSGANKQLHLSNLAMTSSAMSVEGQDLVAAWPAERPPQVAGVLTYSGDVGRLQQWTFDPNHPSIWTFAGRLQGQVRITPLADKPQSVNASIDTQIDDLVGTRPGSDPWREPQIRLVGAARYDRSAGDLFMDRMRVTSTMANCDATGKLTDVAGRRDLALEGQLDYEPEKLLALVRPYLGEGINVVATRQARPFSFSGPLSALSAPPAQSGAAAAVATIDRLYREFQGEAAFGWTGAEIYGFRMASGELRGKLASGVLEFQPLDLAVSEGRFTASPTVRFWPEPKELLLPRGPLLTQVRISPEMCDRALKFIAPVLAGVTQAEGKFSVALDGCRVPLDRPATGELAGQFTVHSVEIGAGPLVRELAVVLDRPGIAKLSRESVVPFRMVEGRVYHRDLELVFPDVTIRTHGSVGLDQSLAIMAEMPVPPKWIGNNPLGVALKNQTIRLPIEGTLQRPLIDRQALARASAEFVRGSATNLLRDTLNKQLDRLFSPPPEEE